MSAFSLRNNQTDSEVSKVFARCRETILLINPLPKTGVKKHMHVLQIFQPHLFWMILRSTKQVENINYSPHYVPMAKEQRGCLLRMYIAILLK